MDMLCCSRAREVCELITEFARLHLDTLVWRWTLISFVFWLLHCWGRVNVNNKVREKSETCACKTNRFGSKTAVDEFGSLLVLVLVVYLRNSNYNTRTKE